MAEDKAASRLTAEQAREIALYPDRWSCYFRTIDGKPFKLDERPYLEEVYRHFGATAKSATTKMILLKCSRKVEKTETICNLLLYGLLNIPYFNAVYTAPRQPQVTRFVEERLNGAMMGSINDGCLMNARLKTSVSHQTFDVGASTLNHLYAYSNWGDGHSLLGIEADLCCIDEYQDSDGDVLPMLVEMMALSEYKWVVVSGTAREQGSEFWRLWEQSSKGEWDSETETWTHGKSNANIIGYHISQSMHPDISEEEIAQKKETYTPRRFANEVLGEFFAGATKPITFDEVLPTFDRERGVVRGVLPPEKTFMGIDWGRETTVVIIDDKGNILNAVKLDSRDTGKGDEVEILKQMIVDYNCVQVVADIGYGARQVRQLQEEFGERVRSCYYTSRPMTPYEYKKRDNNRHLIFMCVVDRTTYVELTVEAIKNKEVSLPYEDESLAWVAHEWCSLTSSEEADAKNTRPVRGQTLTKYGRDGDDHAFHALLYARLAQEVGGDGDDFVMKTFGA